MIVGKFLVAWFSIQVKLFSVAQVEFPVSRECLNLNTGLVHREVGSPRESLGWPFSSQLHNFLLTIPQEAAELWEGPSH